MTYDPIVILPVLPEPPNTQTDAKPVFLEKADAFNPALKAWGEAFNEQIPKLNAAGQNAQTVVDHLDAVIAAPEAAAQAIAAKDATTAEYNKAKAEAQQSYNQAQLSKADAERAKHEAEKALQIALGEIPDASEGYRGLVRYGNTAGTACQGNDPRLIGSIVVSEVAIIGNTLLAIGYATSYTVSATTGLQNGSIVRFTYRLDSEPEQDVIATDNNATFVITIAEDVKEGTAFVLTVTAVDNLGNARSSTKRLSAGRASVNKTVLLYPCPEDVVYSSGFIVILGSFGVIGGEDTHIESEYRVSADISGSLVVAQYTGADLLAHTFIAPELTEGTYYIAARQKGIRFGWGEWSVATKVAMKKAENFLAVIDSIDQSSNFYSSAIAVDSEHNIHIGIYSDRTTPVIKLDAAGNTVWSKNMGNPLRVVNSAIDSLGNIYMHGEEGAYLRSTIIKHDKNGNILYGRQLHPVSGPGHFYGGTLALDAEDNVYFPAMGSNFLAIAKIDAQGDTVWFKKFTGMYRSSRSYGIKVDASGNVYVLSTVDIPYSPNAYGAFLVFKLNSSGDVLWSKYMGHVGVLSYANDISITNDGSVYISGAYLSGYHIGVLIKLDSEGNKVWDKYIHSGGSTMIQSSFCTDNESMYLTGYTQDTAYPIDTHRCFVIKINRNYGNILWQRIVVGTNTTYGWRIFLDNIGNLYVSGSDYNKSSTPRKMNALVFKMPNDMPPGKYGPYEIRQINVSSGVSSIPTPNNAGFTSSDATPNYAISPIYPSVNTYQYPVTTYLKS